jgi:hypothetical protein
MFAVYGAVPPIHDTSIVTFPLELTNDVVDGDCAIALLTISDTDGLFDTRLPLAADR